MDKILIKGGRPLRGGVHVHGAKNSALPLMAAALLAESPCTLHNVPCLHDVFTMDKLLASMGMTIEFTGRYMTLDPTTVTSQFAAYDLVRKMRASFFVLGPLLGRYGEARVSLPGGCAIGTRPVDIHLKGIEALGIEICIDEGYVTAKGKPKGANIALDFPSVGATENLMMAASRADGVTRLSNVAREPEIVDLARFLNAMGARISGAGTDLVTIVGVEGLQGCDHAVIPDRIEAGTFLLAGVATCGDVTVVNGNADHLDSFLAKLREAGADVETNGARIRAAAPNGLKGVNVATQPYPGFPTDLQAQMMAALCIAEGASVIKETVFENRFMQVAELKRMGADIEVDGNSAVVRGVDHLSGAPVMASDLRASASLVIAGLAAEKGETAISRVYHIDRGYERIEERLSGLGAHIERVRENG
ncbi:MAG TPA: UDP-N-acetylglucosamine 1-carboxyvinyltransferase [Candidatus Hydrogenedentes bacterium]|nr:UDP-N-acetylglucosamine 1-carboxyvinyltransferase [Candidatus Hydrogenedentota bacterium]HOS04418.1 UDP-N-acetylglucosamine 1-carboxyvinyltransferase [Candidatus Hydrogenedentota bacterium]